MVTYIALNFSILSNDKHYICRKKIICKINFTYEWIIPRRAVKRR